MSITLADIKLQARQRADMVSTSFVEDSELTSYVNNSIAELHDLLVGAFSADYYMESVEFDADGSQSYDLPDGVLYNGASKFYKLRGLDARLSDDIWTTVRRFNFNRRNSGQDSLATNTLYYPGLEYRLVGTQIRFSKAPDSGTSFRLWYAPVAETLIDPTDAYDDINGYAEYIITDVAIKMLQKQEDDVTVLVAQKKALQDRIEAAASSRDANEPESIQDIYDEDAQYYQFGQD